MSQASPVNPAPDPVAKPVAKPVANPADDPRPIPPERPGDNDCCGSGCDPCIFDYYYQELDRYREELRAWEARQAARHAEDPAS